MFKNVRLKQNSFKPYLQIDVKLINSRSEKITFYSFACFFLSDLSSVPWKNEMTQGFPRRSEDSWGGQILKKRILKSIFRKRKKIWRYFFFLEIVGENFFCVEIRTGTAWGWWETPKSKFCFFLSVVVVNFVVLKKILKCHLLKNKTKPGEEKPSIRQLFQCRAKEEKQKWEGNLFFVLIFFIVSNTLSLQTNGTSNFM